MSEQSYLVTKKQIIKAKNMTHARMLSEGYKDFPGQILHEEIEVAEDDLSSMEEDDDNENYAPHMPEENSLFLRSENRRLAKLAEKYKNVKDEAVISVYQAAFDAFSNFELPKIKSPTLKSNKHNTPETAVAVFADWQMGKITPTYNTEVLEKRIELYTEKLLEITEIQRLHHNVDNLHVWLLGDIVEGEEIFAGQSHLIDSGLYRQVGINGPRILSKFLMTALENFKTVHVTGIIGNHGAVGGKMRKSHDPETNMDRLLYKILELMFVKEDRISFNIPDGKGERNWYAVDNIGNYSSLLIHGDQLPAPAQYYGYFKKVMGWKDGAIPQHFDDVFMGHYHQQFKMTIGSSILRVSGSPESSNTYAQEYFSSMSRPCQHLMFVHPEHGITSEYSVWLDAV
jgi:hypothetical protein